jgi:YHS domain-containing protein
MNVMPRTWKSILLVCLLALLSSAFAEDNDPKRVDGERNLGDNGLAIEGYDPVAYFKEGGGEATPGKPEITHTIGKTTYRFASEAHRELFRKNPAKYEPAYGGWCAYAMGAKGEKVAVNPKAFTITDGTLCLFYKTFVTDTRKPWNKDVATLKPKADTAWKALVERARKQEATAAK